MSLSGVLANKGADVTFSKTTAGTRDPATGRTTAPTTSTVSGSAMEIGGDPQLLIALELIETDSLILLFRPTTEGQLPAIGASVVWGGVTYTVKNIPDRFAMDGVVKAARVVVAR